MDSTMGNVEINSTKEKVGAIFGGLFILTFLSLFVFIFTQCEMNKPESGEIIGYMNQVAKKGLIFDTWECRLSRSGIKNGNGAIDIKPFCFTIENNEMAELAKKYGKEKVEVVLSYNIELMYAQFNSESGGVFATKITPTTNH